MAAEQINLAIPYDDVGFLDLRATGADRLDFPSFQDDSGFETVFDEVIEKGLFVINYAHLVRKPVWSVKISTS